IGAGQDAASVLGLLPLHRSRRGTRCETGEIPLGCAILGVEKNASRFRAHPFPFVNAPNPHRLPSRIAKEDEHLLVAAAKKGDTGAFEELVSRYERKIFRVTMNITRNQQDAEDSMQDAFLKAYAHLKDFGGDSRFYTWLVRIAANEALMRL